MGQRLDKLKMMVGGLAIGGSILAFVHWHDAQRRQDVMANGVQTDAKIENAKRVHSRHGTNYELDMSWTDTSGLKHESDNILISDDFAHQISINNWLIVSRLPIKYVLTEPIRMEEDNVIILSDTAAQSKEDQTAVYFGGGLGIFGLIGSALLYLPGFWRRNASVG